VTTSLNVVIVEDDHHAAESMRLLLENRGHRVQVCLDPETAVELIRARRPDVALLDIMMPAIDGIEICRRLKTVPELAKLQMIMVTGKAYDVDHERARRAGARGVMMKPLDPRTFVDEIVTRTLPLAG
jgi:CheY-like chemotaxis protein